MFGRTILEIVVLCGKRMKDGSGVTKTPRKLEADMSSAHISSSWPGSARFFERAKKTCQANQCSLRIGLLPAIVCLFVYLFDSVRLQYSR